MDLNSHFVPRFLPAPRPHAIARNSPGANPAPQATLPERHTQFHAIPRNSKAHPHRIPPPPHVIGYDHLVDRGCSLDPSRGTDHPRRQQRPRCYPKLMSSSPRFVLGCHRTPTTHTTLRMFMGGTAATGGAFVDWGSVFRREDHRALGTPIAREAGRPARWTYGHMPMELWSSSLS